MHNNLYFHVKRIDGKVVSSNFPAFLINEVIENLKCETILCPHVNLKRRQILVKRKECEIIFCSYDSSITNTIFKHYCNAFEIMVPQILQSYSEVHDIERKKTRRLKHNLITHCSNIQQELYKLIPQENIIKGKSNQLGYIKDTLLKNSNNASYAFLRILKNVNFMKAEFDVYDMLNGPSPYLDFQSHL